MTVYENCECCGEILTFVQQPPNSKNRWKVICNKCSKKTNEDRVIGWLADFQIEEMLKMDLRLRLVPFDLMGKAQVRDWRRVYGSKVRGVAAFEKRRQEELIAKLAKKAESVRLSVEDEKIIKAILQKNSVDKD